jgi:hypothetical protein
MILITPMKIATALVMAVLALQGCASAKFTLGPQPQGASSAAPTLQEREPNFVSGFGQQHVIDAAKVCGAADKVASVEVIQTAWDGVVAFITFGIYTPLTARVYCK